MEQETRTRRTKTPRIVACIPAYNEENHIGPVVLKALSYVDQVIVCDDGSRDLTGQIAAMMGATVLTHERNMGYGVAIRSLLDEAVRLGAEIAVTLDGDGQHDPADIPSLLNQMNASDSDIVIGSRFLEGAHHEASSWRENGIRMITRLVSGKDEQITDAQSGIRAYNRMAMESLVLTEDGMGVSTEILVKAREKGLNVNEVPVTIYYNEKSSTHNPIVHSLDVVLNTLKHMSINRPLLFYGGPGIISLLISMFFWIWTIEVFTRTRGVITNVTLVAIGTTIVGLMLLTTAIILWVIVSVIREKVSPVTRL